MRIECVAQLSDRDLLDATQRVTGDTRTMTARLLALLGEVERRRLYFGQSCSSLFTYCTQVLHLSEHAAYHRIEGARAARDFPCILDMVASGALTLTSVALLRPHLTTENHRTLLDAARHKSKRDVEKQVAGLAPRPDAQASLRKLPVPRLSALPQAEPVKADGHHTIALRVVEPTMTQDADVAFAPPPATRPTLRPLAPARYLLKVTITDVTHAKLRRAQDLMRHTVPSGDPAAIVDRALTLLVEQLERMRMAKTARPGRTAATTSRTRHVPAAIKRAVWARDQGQCRFVGVNGRCRETSFIELHHVVPFADGGPTSLANLELRCRAHNVYESVLWAGGELPCD